MFGIRTSRYVYGRESLEGTNKSCSRYSPDRLKFRECSPNFPSKTTTEHEQINFFDPVDTKVSVVRVQICL